MMIGHSEEFLTREPQYTSDYDDKEKLIDLGHADFIMPFKPAVKDYQIELPNACGADIRGIFASIFASLSNNI